MSYTVLARKWRPKKFAELVGQTHVMQALSNALDQQRLHHAYLFTGTRGVGKTTIARIFAKALNCEQGISATPCGVCSVCQSVDQGRFVDLIEVDAASRTKVEDTREILDNVQYAPTQGRFKVYLIDEVHMLSKSSFNALLKTLEEPPEHVKFLLATTDPHKLPITVLSRCLQFNLLRLTRVQIQQHLSQILQAEGIDFEPTALALIAKGADGSARDALSLLDQAIAYCGGKLRFEPVQTMLGLVDQGQVLAILQALANDSAADIRQLLQRLSSLGVDYVALLNQLLEGLHQLSMQQVLGEVSEEGAIAQAQVIELAQTLSVERVQLLYQIGLLAQQDMKLAPDVRIGFEMALLRMLAFKPQMAALGSPSAPSDAFRGKPVAAATATIKQTLRDSAPPSRQRVAPADVAPAVSPSASAPAKPTDFPSLMSRMQQRIAPAEVQTSTPSAAAALPLRPTLAPDMVEDTLRSTQMSAPVLAATSPSEDVQPSAALMQSAPWPEVDQDEVVQDQFDQDHTSLAASSSLTEGVPLSTSPTPADVSEALEGEASLRQWQAFVQQIDADGMALALARNVMLCRVNQQAWWLSVDPAQQAAKTEVAQQRLLQAARRCFGEHFMIHYVDYDGVFFTLHRQEAQALQQQQALAREAILADEKVQTMQQQWGMTLLEQTIKPLEMV
ncbi:MAG: DNA polymerase III subunit gamma/tau [Thiomicrospira sp.]